MSRRGDHNPEFDAVEKLLSEFFHGELAREMPPLPDKPAICPQALPGVTERFVFGVLLAAGIACLMLVLYLDATRGRTKDSALRPGTKDAAVVAAEPRPLGLLVFDEPQGAAVEVVPTETGDQLVIERREGWRHVVWPGEDEQPTVWMAFPVVDIEWTLASNAGGERTNQTPQREAY